MTRTARGLYQCLDEGDQHDDSRCDGSNWGEWGWVMSWTVQGRICGTCRAWQYRFYDEDGNPTSDPRSETEHRSIFVET